MDVRPSCQQRWSFLTLILPAIDPSRVLTAPIRFQEKMEQHR